MDRINITNEQLQLINSMAGVSPVAKIGNHYPDLRIQVEKNVASIVAEKDEIVKHLKELKLEQGLNIINALATAMSDKLPYDTGCFEDNFGGEREQNYPRLVVRDSAERIYDLANISKTLAACFECLMRIEHYEERVELAKNRVLL